MGSGKPLGDGIYWPRLSDIKDKQDVESQPPIKICQGVSNPNSKKKSLNDSRNSASTAHSSVQV